MRLEDDVFNSSRMWIHRMIIPAWIIDLIYINNNLLGI